MTKMKSRKGNGNKPVEVARASMGALSNGADSFAPEGTDEKLIRPGLAVVPLTEAERLKATQAAIAFGDEKIES